MKFKQIITFIIIFFASLKAFAEVQNKDIEKYCFGRYSESVKDYKNRAIEGILYEWEKYKEECAIDGIYERYLAYIYTAYGFLDKGEKILEQKIQDAKFDTKKLEFFLGGLYHNHDDTNKYKILIDELLKKYPNWFGGYYHLGVYQIDYEKNYNAGRQSLLKALKIVDKEYIHYILCDLAIVEHYLGHHESVYEYYKRAFIVNPLYVTLRPNLAIYSINSFVKIKKFKAAADVIRNIERHDPSILKNPDYLKAKAYYERAVKAKGK